MILYFVVDGQESPATEFWRSHLRPAFSSRGPAPIAEAYLSGVKLDFSTDGAGFSTVLRSTGLRENGQAQTMVPSSYQQDGPHFSRVLAEGIIEHIHSDSGRAEIAWEFDAHPDADIDIEFALEGHRYQERSVSGYHFVDTEDKPSFLVSHAFLVDSAGKTKPVPLRASSLGLMASVASSDFDGLQFPVAVDPVIEVEVSAGAATNISLLGAQKNVAVATITFSPFLGGIQGSVAVWEDFGNPVGPELRLSRLSLAEGRVEDPWGRLVALGGRDADIDCNELQCAIVFKTDSGVQLSVYDFALDEIWAVGSLSDSTTATSPKVSMTPGNPYAPDAYVVLGAGLSSWTDVDGLHIRSFRALAGALGDFSPEVTNLTSSLDGVSDIVRSGSHFVVVHGQGTELQLYRVDFSGEVQDSNILSGVGSSLGALSAFSLFGGSLGIAFVDGGGELKLVRTHASTLVMSSAVETLLVGGSLSGPSLFMPNEESAHVSVLQDGMPQLLSWSSESGTSVVHSNSAPAVSGGLAQGYNSSTLWAYDDGDDVYFRAIGSDHSVGEEAPLSVRGLNQHYPAMAARPGEYLLIWTEHDTLSNRSIRYRGRRFAFDGSALDSEVQDIFDLENYDAQNTRDTVTAGPDGYLVMATPALVSSRPSTYRVFYEGAWQAIQTLPGFYSIHPRAASDGERYLATWRFASELKFQFIGSDGSLEGPAFSWADPEGLTPQRPSIVHDGSRYVVVYEASDAANRNDRCLRGLTVDNDGTLGAAQELTECLDSRREIIPKLSAAEDGVLLSYIAQDLPGGLRSVAYMSLNTFAGAASAPGIVGETANFFRGHAGDGVSHALSVLQSVGGTLKPVLSTFFRGEAHAWPAFSDALSAHHHYEHELASDGVGRYMMAYKKLLPVSGGGYGYRMYLRGFRFEDDDQDGHLEHVDNCPEDFNPEQRDLDEDGIGDACACVPEICNGRDDDCDGESDEGCVACADEDGDGYAVFGESCGIPLGDCHDGDVTVSPAVLVDVADGIDNNCNGLIDEGAGCEILSDADRDGHISEHCGGDDCDDHAPGVWSSCRVCSADEVTEAQAFCTQGASDIGEEFSAMVDAVCLQIMGDSELFANAACNDCRDDDGDGFFIGCDSYDKVSGPDCDDGNADEWRECDGDGDTPVSISILDPAPGASIHEGGSTTVEIEGDPLPGSTLKIVVNGEEILVDSNPSEGQVTVPLNLTPGVYELCAELEGGDEPEPPGPACSGNDVIVPDLANGGYYCLPSCRADGQLHQLDGLGGYSCQCLLGHIEIENPVGSFSCIQGGGGDPLGGGGGGGIPPFTGTVGSLIPHDFQTPTTGEGRLVECVTIIVSSPVTNPLFSLFNPALPLAPPTSDPWRDTSTSIRESRNRALLPNRLSEANAQIQPSLLPLDHHYRGQRFDVEETTHNLKLEQEHFQNTGRGSLEFLLKRVYSTQSHYQQRANVQINKLRREVYETLLAQAPLVPEMVFESRYHSKDEEPSVAKILLETGELWCEAQVSGIQLSPLISPIDPVYWIIEKALNDARAECLTEQDERHGSWEDGEISIDDYILLQMSHRDLLPFATWGPTTCPSSPNYPDECAAHELQPIAAYQAALYYVQRTADRATAAITTEEYWQGNGEENPGVLAILNQSIDTISTQRQWPVRLGLGDGWSLNLPYLQLPDITENRVGALLYDGAYSLEYKNPAAALFSNIDGVLVDVSSTLVPEHPEAGCSAEKEHWDNITRECLIDAFGSDVVVDGQLEQLNPMVQVGPVEIRGELRPELKYRLSIRDTLYYFDVWGRVIIITDLSHQNAIEVFWQAIPVSNEDALRNGRIDSIVDASGNLYGFSYYADSDLEALVAAASIKSDDDPTPLIRSISSSEKRVSFSYKPFGQCVPDASTPDCDDRALRETVWKLDAVEESSLIGPPSQFSYEYDYELDWAFQCEDYDLAPGDNSPETIAQALSACRGEDNVPEGVVLPLLSQVLGPYEEDWIVAQEASVWLDISYDDVEWDFETEEGQGIFVKTAEGGPVSSRFLDNSDEQVGVYRYRRDPKVRAISGVSEESFSSNYGGRHSTAPSVVYSHDGDGPKTEVRVEATEGGLLKRSKEYRDDDVRRRISYQYDGNFRMVRVEELFYEIGLDQPERFWELEYPAASTVSEQIRGIYATPISVRRGGEGLDNPKVTESSYHPFLPWKPTRIAGTQPDTYFVYFDAAPDAWGGLQDPERTYRPIRKIVYGTPTDFRTTNFFQASYGLVETRFPDGSAEEFFYDVANLGSSTETDHAYLSTMERLGSDGLSYSTSSFERDSFGNLLSNTDAEGNQWGSTYDGFGRPLTQSLPASQVTTLSGAEEVLRGPVQRNFEYTNVQTTYHQRSGANDSLIETVRIAPGPYGRMAQRKNSWMDPVSLTLEEIVYKYEWTEGLPTAIVIEGADEDFEVIRRTFDNLNRVKTKTEGQNNTETFVYIDFGAHVAGRGPQIQISDADGVREVHFDQARRRVGVTRNLDIDGSGIPQYFTWLYREHPFGEIESVLSPSGDALYVGYDDYGQKVSETRWNDSTLADAPSSPAACAQDERLDASCSRKTWLYGSDGMLNSATDGRGALTSYHYGLSPRIEEVTDAENNSITLSYDALDRVKERCLHGLCEAWDYDFSGAIIRHVDMEGIERLTERDLRGRLIRHSNSNATAVTALAYGVFGQLRRRIDAEGHSTEWSYDWRGLLSEVTIPELSRTFDYVWADDLLSLDIQVDETPLQNRTFDSKGRETGIAYASTGLFENIEYNGLGLVSRRLNPQGEELYNYRPDGQVSSIESFDGEVQRWSYDYAGREISHWFDDNGIVREEWETVRDAAGNPTIESNPLGNSTTTLYDGLGRVLERTVEGSGTWSYTYLDAERKMSSVLPDNSEVAPPAGARVETTLFDGLGRPTSYTDAGAYLTTYSYHPLGMLEEERVLYEGKEAYTRFEFEKDGLLKKIFEGGATQERLVEERLYNAARQLTRSADALGYGMSWFYDERGQPSRTLSDEVGETEYTVDNAGRVTESRFFGFASKTPASNALISSVDFDDATGTVSTTPAGLGTWVNKYTPGGKLFEEYDPGAHYTGGDGELLRRFSYDYAGRIASVVDAFGSDIDYIYNDLGQYIGMAVAEDGVTFEPRGESFIFDARGQVASSVTEVGISTYSYWPDGSLRQQVNAGNTTDFDYSPSGLLIEMNQSTGALGELKTVYTHDLRGNAVSVDESGYHTSNLSFVYDEFGQKVAEYPTGSPSEASDAAYFTDGKLRRINTVEYTRDAATGRYSGFNHATRAAANRVLGDALVANGGTASGAFTYDDYGRVSNRTVGGESTVYSYKDFGELAAYTVNGEGATLEYGDNALVSSVTRVGSTSNTETFDYAFRRLRDYSSASPTVDLQFTHGALGELQSISDNATSNILEERNYDRFQRLTSVSTPGDPNRQYFYDSFGNLESEVPSTGTIRSWEQDPMGRVWSYFEDDTLVSTFSYDALHRLQSETGPEGTSQTRYFDVDTVAFDDGIGTTWQLLTHPENGEMVSAIANSNDLAVPQYLNGNIVGYTGSATSSTSYKPYGENNDESLTLPFGFEGYQALQSGGYRALARNYDPQARTFASVDPIFGELDRPRSLNGWGTFLGNPVGVQDVFGLVPLEITQNYESGSSGSASVTSDPYYGGGSGSYDWWTHRPMWQMSYVSTVAPAVTSPVSIDLGAAARSVGASVSGRTIGATIGPDFYGDFGGHRGLGGSPLAICEFGVCLASATEQGLFSLRIRPPEFSQGQKDKILETGITFLEGLDALLNLGEPDCGPAACIGFNPLSGPGVGPSSAGKKAIKQAVTTGLKHLRKKLARRFATKGAGKACFPAGTEVLTDDGLVSIENVGAGDFVACANTDDGSWEYCEVQKRLSHDYDGILVSVTLEQESIEATGNHPFWVTSGESLDIRPVAEDAGLDGVTNDGEGRWVAAEDLAVGDRLLLADGTRPLVEELSYSSVSIVVFNLQVAGLETYAVGGGGVLVHNKSAAYRITKEMASRSRVIAEGKGIRKVEELVRKFGGKAKKWKKKSVIDDAGNELHFYEHPGIGKVGIKPKGQVDPF